MILNLLLGFDLLVSSSIPQGTNSLDTPSGLSIAINQRYYIDCCLIFSDYKRSNYEIKMYGLAAGKEFILLNHLSILPEVGALKISRERTSNQETGFSPVFSLRLLYLFPSESPQFQIGFTLKEIFDEEIDVDFLDIGIGFRL